MAIIYKNDSHATGQVVGVQIFPESVLLGNYGDICRTIPLGGGFFAQLEF
jgi:hypothetical protein